MPQRRTERDFARTVGTVEAVSERSMQGPTLVSVPAADTQARPLPPSGRLLIDERLQDFHQRSLLIGREPGQRKRSPRHPPQQLRPDPRTGWRELEHFHAAVAGRGLAPDQAASLEPVDQSRDVRRSAGQRVGEPPDRQRPVGLDQVQHMALDRRELEVRVRRQQMLPLREEKFHEKLPGWPRIRFGSSHRGQYT